MKDLEDRSKNRKEVLAMVLWVVAVILVSQGIWDITTEIISLRGSLALGLGLVGVIGYIRRDLIERLF